MYKFRQALKLSWICMRWHSSSISSQYAILENTDSGYAILKMNRKPVNSLNLALVEDMTTALNTAEHLQGCEGLIITSNYKAFCAGVDLNEFYQPDQERLRLYVTSLQELILRLYSSPLVTMAAINGASPAGGCASSLACDYRVMADGKFTIGLNETYTGVALPLPVSKLLQSVVGYRAAERMAVLGSLLLPQEALKVGLVDDVTSVEELMTTVETEMKKWLSIPGIGRTKTKHLMRRDYIEELTQTGQEEVEELMQSVNNPIVQSTLGKYFNSL